MLKINSLFKKKQKLNNREIDAALNKISKEYDKFIVTYHKPISIKKAFEQRYNEALMLSMDLERFLSDEIIVIRSLFEKQKILEKNKLLEIENERIKEEKKNKPDFADKILKQLKDKITVYPALKIHKDASYEIVHLYGAIDFLEKHHWPKLDIFIRASQNWALRGEKKDFNNLIWRFIPSGPQGIPPVLERYNLLLCSDNSSLKDISREAQECIKNAAFLLNDIVYSCNIIKKKGIDSSSIEKNLEFVQHIIDDFRIKDFRNG